MRQQQKQRMTPGFLAGVTKKLEFLFLKLEKKLDKQVFLKGNEESGLEATIASQRECWLGHSRHWSAIGVRGRSCGYGLRRRCLIPSGCWRPPRRKSRLRRSLWPGFVCLWLKRRRRKNRQKFAAWPWPEKETKRNSGP